MRHWGPEERHAYKKGIEKAKAEQQEIAMERCAAALEALVELLKNGIEVHQRPNVGN